MTNKEIAIERIKKCKDDTYLNLSGLGLTEIPNEISSLPNLDYLNLSCNNIQDVTPIVSLIKLKGLYLNENKIQDVSQLAALTKLQFLFLYLNNIKDYTKLTSLRPKCKIFY